MKPTEELMHEHEIILHMLSGAEKLVQSIKTSRSVDVEKIRDVIDFSRHFTDGCHHAKEEKHLFVRLAARGMSQDQGPIGVMLHEHDLGRTLIKAAETALEEYRSGKQNAADAISQSLEQYISLLRAHIFKENNILFPMVDRFLTPEDQISLEETFKNVEQNEIGAGVHEKYHRMAHEIAK